MIFDTLTDYIIAVIFEYKNFKNRILNQLKYH